MHTVIVALCTGCELCVAPCPVDCIAMLPRASLADAPGAPAPEENRERFGAHNTRTAARAGERAALLTARKQAGPAASSNAGCIPPPAGRSTGACRPPTRLRPRNFLYSSPFELLVAVMLSAHTTDRSVNAATRKLFPVANTPAAILALGVAGVKPYIRAVGLYNTKTNNLLGLARQLIERHGGEVPAERAALEALPGVGRKTASIILNTVFGQAEIAVDTHSPRRQPHRPRPGQDAAGGRGCVTCQHARRVQKGCAPLADPARPLRLYSPLPGLPQMHHPRPVRVPAQDAGACGESSAADAPARAARAAPGLVSGPPPRHGERS